jgi:hypothetical protein
MNKTELTQILDTLSDEKLDMFISFLRHLRETEDNEPLQEVSRQVS